MCSLRQLEYPVLIFEVGVRSMVQHFAAVIGHLIFPTDMSLAKRTEDPKSWFRFALIPPFAHNGIFTTFHTKRNVYA